MYSCSIRRVMILAMLTATAACSDERSATGPTEPGPAGGNSIWRPASQQFRVDCDAQSCEDLGEVQIAHLGTVRMYAQPDVDDAISQWAGCLDSALECLDSGLSANCVAVASCPTECKLEYAESVADASEPMAYLAEFQRIFIDAGGLCRPRPTDR